MAFLHGKQEAANGICGRSPLVCKEIEKLLGKTCGNITTTDLAGIRTLNLSSIGNRDVTTLNKNDFDGLTNLRVLTLKHNRCSSLPAGLFDELINLKKLELVDTGLSSLPAGLFDKLTNLEQLRLHDRRIDLPAGLFDELINLKKLQLAYTGHISLPSGVFDKLTSLEGLFLDSYNLDLNKLSSLPPGVFDKLTNLQDLHLWELGLSNLPLGVFDKLTNLQHLCLLNNKLSRLPSGVFDKLTSLRGLNLQGNNLTCLPAIPGSVTSLELDKPRWTYPACQDTGDPAPSPASLSIEDTTDAADLADLKTMGKVVGIDLGTTNSCVAVVEGGRPVVVSNAEGNRTTPSVVAYALKSKDLLVGKMAKRQAVTNPDNTFYSVKRFLGCTRAEVKDDLRKVAYGVKPAGNRLTIDCPVMGKALAPEEVSAQVLRKLAADASAFLGSKVTHAVVTVPAYFNDAQRQATRNAAWIAGLEVLRIVNEPTAAALAYGLGNRKDACILVFDLGGGTFDVSILQMEEDACEVLATSGDTHLGGDDFDKVIVDHLAETFKEEEGIDLRENSQTLQRLKQAAEEAKIELSSATRSDVNLPFISGGKVLDVTITRERFNDLSSHLLERCRIPVETALADAGLSAADLDEVVLVGGSTRIPAVKDLVKTLTGKDPNQTVNPDEVVALGAAVQANLLAGDTDSRITLPAEDGKGEAPDDLAMLLLDVTPLSLGTEDGANGRMIRIIDRNASIPAKEQTIVTTVRDNQTSVVVKVFQGEQAMARDNKCLGDFKLDGIRPEPRGVPKIVVAMEIDANGILNVTARDQATGVAAFISISGSSTLSEAEVAHMRKDAEDNAAG